MCIAHIRISKPNSWSIIVHVAHDRRILPRVCEFNHPVKKGMDTGEKFCFCQIFILLQDRKLPYHAYFDIFKQSSLVSDQYIYIHVFTIWSSTVQDLKTWSCTTKLRQHDVSSTHETIWCWHDLHVWTHNTSCQRVHKSHIMLTWYAICELTLNKNSCQPETWSCQPNHEITRSC